MHSVTNLTVKYYNCIFRKCPDVPGRAKMLYIVCKMLHLHLI
ncbi:hypothetical protein CLOBOL_06492 [Enterocloster bolteae ATCC BAA-613]|uniref:Uncharacterized protein n=1 Tax=Enterocloster bolteae (strain ATCC BAA-613 / DSM 15670 / CCUG 46953 / JCM 12243 / WAL 16351) TaxID=411902 RepID=A8S349_ENTBW|nr:hypothetical protein CLOBOL_06492 [Enterocloster bolteae ATCC BAA-613]